MSYSNPQHADVVSLDKSDQIKLSEEPTSGVDVASGSVSVIHDGLQRRLGNRQIQLIAIGGSIGTALFITIGSALEKSGPGSLFLAFFIYCMFLACVNNCMAEMSTYMPVSGGFVRLAGKWVDEAFGFMAGWNFFFYEAICIPFEITALYTVLSFWSDKIPVAAICAACMVLYAIMNVLAVRIYGESEFWLSGGKIFLIFILFAFTFVTMVGGNPKGDAYGFRYWNKPGSFAEHLGSGSLGRFEGFLAALWTASFTCVGPEYVSIVAAEAKHPRIYIKNAFKTMYWRFGIFFIGSALCCGIVIAYNDPTLVAIYSGASGGSGTASACPYVIAMKNLGISVLPHIVNAILLTSIFSAGNTYTYCATRTLYGLALEGRAPKFFTKCWRNGVPIYCFIAVIAFSALSFLQVSNNSATVLSWLVNLVTASGLITYIVMCVTYICFYRACKAQGLDRSTLPYKGWFQPWCGYIGLVWMILVVGSYGYSSFMPWDVDTFLTYYMMVFVSIVLFVGWKLIKRTKFLGPKEIDLIWEAPIVTAYEEIMSVQEPPVGFWAEIFQVVNIRKLKSDKQETSKA